VILSFSLLSGKNKENFVLEPDPLLKSLYLSKGLTGFIGARLTRWQRNYSGISAICDIFATEPSVRLL